MAAARKAFHDLAPSTQEVYRRLNSRTELSPRARMALRMYVNAAVPTLRAAAEAVGISYTYLTLVAKSPAGQEFMETAHSIINDKAATTSALIERLGRRAIEVIGTTMEDSQSENLRLKAAIDLADRSPDTAKSQKVQLEAFTLEGKDAQLLALALAEGREVEARFAEFKFKNHEPRAEDDIAALPPGITESANAEENK